MPVPRAGYIAPFPPLRAHLAVPGCWQRQEPSLGDGREGRGLRDAHRYQIPYLSRTIFSAKLPTKRSG